MSTQHVPIDPDPADPPHSAIPRWLKMGVLGLVVVVAVGYGLIFLYAKVLNDGPDELDQGDLDAALAVDSGGGAGSSQDDGSTVWTVTEGSELGYRVKEVLFGVDTEAVGRTAEITGALTIRGRTVTQASFEVDVASITSDESRRDNRFRGSVMSTDRFPTATFTLTSPIELGLEPVDGAEVATTGTGDLTLRGVTRPVTFDLTAKLANGRIGVLGAIPVVFADYQIANPSTGGITTQDDGLVEFVLVFQQ